jgi:hypothetical protein
MQAPQHLKFFVDATFIFTNINEAVSCPLTTLYMAKNHEEGAEMQTSSPPIMQILIFHIPGS